MASKRNQSAHGKEVVPIAIAATGPITRSKSKALAQQSFERQPVITLDFLRKNAAEKSLSIGENSYSGEEFTRSISDEISSYDSHSDSSLGDSRKDVSYGYSHSPTSSTSIIMPAFMTSAMDEQLAQMHQAIEDLKRTVEEKDL